MRMKGILRVMGQMRKRVNKGVLQIFCALMLVVSLMFASNYVVFRNSAAEIYGQVSENNKLVIGSVIQSFDDCFRDINNLVYAIHMLPFETLQSADGGGIDMVKAYTMQQQVANLVSSSSMHYIQEVAVFFGGSDFAVTSAGTTSLQELFKQNYRHPLYNTEYWKSYALTEHALKIFPEADYVDTTAGYEENRRRLLIVAGNNNLSNKNVMILLDVPKLMTHVLKSMVHGTSLTVLDQDRNVLVSTDKDGDIVNILNESLLKAHPDATLTQKQYEYHFYQSDFNGFVYINKTDYAFQSMKSVNERNRIIMFAAIAGAVILSVFLSLYLYDPMKKIYALFGGGDSRGSDYQTIRSSIVKIQEENRTYKSDLDILHTDIRRGVFLDALDGFRQSREFEDKIRHYFRDFLHGEFFVMASFRLKPPLDNDADEPVSAPIDEWKETIRQGLHSNGSQAAVFYTGQLHVLALIEIRDKSGRAAVIEDLTAFVTRINADSADGYSLSAAVSRLYTPDSRNFQLAYRDLNYCRIYRNISVTSPVIDIEAIRFTWKIHLPLDEMEKLSHYMVGGHDLEAIEVINRIVKENASRGIHHHQLVSIAKCLFYQISKHLDETAVNQREIATIEHRFNRDVEGAADYEDIRERLVRLVQYFVANNVQGQRSKLNPGFISQYISLHYMENLYQEHMAELLGTTPKYFSTYFKKTFGTNYVEYLHKVRISHAKEYLKNTDLTVAEIGEKVGYPNSSTFATTFKRYSGISPSEYRDTSLK